MRLISSQHLDDGLLERRVTVGDVPAILWTSPTTPDPAQLLLLGHPGGLDAMYPRVVGRARRYAAAGFAAAAVELPGAGDRPRSASAEEARADLRRALSAGEPVGEIVDRLVLPLVDAAVPEHRAALDDLLALPELTGPVGIDGGIISVGVRLAAVDPRVQAAVLYAGSRIPRAIVEEARAVTIPVQVLLQWDDEWNDRQEALDLFDALGSRDKTLHANLGGHTGVPAHELDSAAAFFVRHLT